MHKVVTYKIAGENINYTGLLSNLDFEVISLKKFPDIMELDSLDLLLCDGKFYIQLKDEIKQELRQRFKMLKIVLTGEFSDSYLFDKARLENVDDFIVVPFGYKECLNMVERLGFKYNRDVLKQESFEEL